MRACRLVYTIYSWESIWKPKRRSLTRWCFSHKHETSGPMSDKIQKDVIRIFWENFSLKITITTNWTVLTVCSYHVTCTYLRVNPLYICLNFKELLTQNRRDIWSLNDCNGTLTHNHLVCKRIFNHMAKLACLAIWLSVRLRTEWLWVRVPLQSNWKIVNFLDVTLDLCTGRYQPYKKRNNTPTYINVNSNHPSNIIKVLPDNISKQISNISSDKATFINAAPFYNDVSASGYKESLTYQKDLPPSNKVRQRKMIWFNPPYSVNAERNIGKTFLKRIDKHSPKTNMFHKIFNRNNVKVRYSCLHNFANIIKAYNKRILYEQKTQTSLNVIADRKMLVL